MFQIGETVVNVKGPSTAGDFDLQAQRGRWVVLYFYPKDNTSACTIEARDFTAAVPQFEALNRRLPRFGENPRRFLRPPGTWH